MASITIRRLEDKVKAKLQVCAARNGRSMEEEAREILKAAVQ
jgi:antitoxin FitA